MSNKTMKTWGIILIVVNILSVVAAIVLWFANYLAMQEGYYQYGDPIMNAFGVCCCTTLLGYVGLPLVIIGACRKEDRNVPAACKYCGFCGTKLNSDAKFCTKCGQKLP